MAKISNTALTNTFDFWRLRTNELADRVSQFAITNSMLYANTLIANNYFKSSGNTVLGASGKHTIINGIGSANGRFIISKSLVSSGNNVLGAVGKRTIINGLGSANGTFSVTTNATVTGNTTSNKVIVTNRFESRGNNVLGASGKYNIFNGTTIANGSFSASSFSPTNMTVSGNGTFGTILSSKIRAYSEYINTQTVSSGAFNIDCADSNIFKIALQLNSTLSFTNLPTSGIAFTVTLYITQDVTGSRVISWPASVKWPGGTAPTLTTTANKTDIISLTTLDGGTNWYGGFSLGNL